MKNLLAIKNLLINLKTRKNLYVFDNSYSSLTSFLVGYILAIRDSTSDDLSEEFKKWLEAKEQKEFAIHWSGYILLEMSNNDSLIAEQNLISLWEEFIKMKEKKVQNKGDSI